MTDEIAEDRPSPRRKFDDVASLFGSIVPVPGADSDAARAVPPPPIPLERPPLQPMFDPPAAVQVFQPEFQAEPPPPPKPPPPPRPAEIPWPDAFEPLPNYRRRETRNWSWLLLIPIGFVAAFGITQLDPLSIRTWLGEHVLHRIALPGSERAPSLVIPPGTLSPSPLPEPPRAQPPSPPPPSAQPSSAQPSSAQPPAAQPSAAQPASAQPPAVLPSAAPTPSASVAQPDPASIPYPALPTSPPRAPPGAETAPEPDPTPAAAPTPMHITIQYRRDIPGSSGEARRISAILQSHGGSIELHPNVATVRVPTIYYFNAADKDAANELATALAYEANNWNVRLGPVKRPLGSLDVWLP